LIPSQDKKEEELAAMQKSLVVHKNFMRNIGFNRAAMSKPIKVKLFSAPVVTVSAVNTAIALNTNVVYNTATFPEQASFAAVYDECRVLGVKVHYFFYLGTSSSSNGGGPCALAINFDPTSPAPTGLVSILSQAHNTGAHFLSSSVIVTSVATAHGKYPTLSARTPGPLAPITSSDVPGSAWFAVDGGTAPIIFNMNAYTSPIGALGVTNLSVFYELDVEYRLRV